MQNMTREEFKQIKNNTISEKWQHVILKRKFLTKFEKWKQKNCHDLLRWVNFLGATFLDILHICRHPLVLDINQKSLLWRKSHIWQNRTFIVIHSFKGLTLPIKCTLTPNRKVVKLLFTLGAFISFPIISFKRNVQRYFHTSPETNCTEVALPPKLYP